MMEVAPGKNSGVYQSGHLTAMHDALFRIIRMCREIFPEYADIFLWSPDKTVADLPSLEEIKQWWLNVNIQLKKCFSQIHTNEWYERHIGQLILLKRRGLITNY